MSGHWLILGLRYMQGLIRRASLSARAEPGCGIRLVTDYQYTRRFLIWRSAVDMSTRPFTARASTALTPAAGVGQRRYRWRFRLLIEALAAPKYLSPRCGLDAKPNRIESSDGFVLTIPLLLDGHSASNPVTYISDQQTRSFDQPLPLCTREYL